MIVVMNLLLLCLTKCLVVTTLIIIDKSLLMMILMKEGLSNILIEANHIVNQIKDVIRDSLSHTRKSEFYAYTS
jgi:hypothetical protein